MSLALAYSFDLFNPGLPSVANASASIGLNPTTGLNVVTVPATNYPTSWAILSGDAPGNFAIDNTGLITVTATGHTNITSAATFTLTVRATNPYGSGTGTVVIDAFSPSLDFSDSRDSQYIPVL